MEYYVLTIGKDIVEPLTFTNLTAPLKTFMTDEDFRQLDKAVVAHFKDDESVEITDILVQPTFIISTEVKLLFELYDEEMQFIPLQLFSQNIENVKCLLYWLPNIPIINCLHSSTAKYDTGLIKELVIDGNQIGQKDIFRVGDIIENRVIISLPVAESLLRREMAGIGLEPVKVRE